MARIRTNKNICLFCFGDLDLQRSCTACGKKADDSPSLPHHLPQRTVLNNKYLISKALGEGGFGITYLAWDLQQGIKTAIKEYFPSGYVNRVPKSNQVIINSKQNQAASNRGLKRFIEEAKVLAKIKNLSGIVSVRDFFSANGTAYIVMEFLDGISMKKYMQRKGGKITTDEVLTILRPVMESLTQVHDLGLIHRDISPDNILITKYNEVKLIDFGAAKQSNLDGKSLSIVLKQGFAPEEQYRTHGEQGPWTDVYALGVTIYYCITGKLPPESIQRMYKDTIIKPSELGAQITSSQENALMKSLAVYSKNRYQDVRQLIGGLYGIRTRNTLTATVPPPTSTARSAQAAEKPESKAAAKATPLVETPAHLTPRVSPAKPAPITPQTPAKATPLTPARPGSVRPVVPTPLAPQAAPAPMALTPVAPDSKPAGIKTIEDRKRAIAENRAKFLEQQKNKK